MVLAPCTRLGDEAVCETVCACVELVASVWVLVLYCALLSAARCKAMLLGARHVLASAYCLQPSRPDCQQCLQVKETDIAEHVRARLAKDKAEKERRRKEKEEAHLYINARVARDEDMREQIGNTLTFDLVDFDKVGGSFSAHSLHTVPGLANGCLLDELQCGGTYTTKPGICLQMPAR